MAKDSAVFDEQKAKDRFEATLRGALKTPPTRKAPKPVNRPSSSSPDASGANAKTGRREA
ncbi:hypothetical protein [Rhodopila sp.]|uniref:hypothetical protein n=1 Tax=Rhodopila sp. TaxID=2480087 RepID=UPI003D0E4A34